jgi:hypothetical protein
MATTCGRGLSLDWLRVLQGDGLGAVQDDPAEDPRPECVDARRAGSQVEVRQVRQAAGAILLPREAKRRAGVCAELLGSATSHFYFARTSALDRIPDSSRTSRKVREVPILLQKSVEGFCEQ